MQEKPNASRKKSAGVIVVLMLISSLASLGIGLRSGSQHDRLFLLARDMKRLIVPPRAIITEQWKFNEFGQLTWYHNKTEIANPAIDDKTIVAFVFGQSNSANSGGERYISKGQNVLNYFDGKFYIAADPLLGASGHSGNVWTNLGNKIVENSLASNVVLIPAGVGATSVKDWQDGGWLNKMLRARLEDARDRNLNIAYFLWHQGESDHALPPDQYLDGLGRVIDLTKEHFPRSKFFVAQASRCGITASSRAIIDAQLAITSRKDVFIGPNTDEIGLDDRYDDCHFSGRGLETHAQGWMESLKKANQ